MASRYSIVTGLVATGTDQGSALQLNPSVTCHVVNTVAAGTGVRLPSSLTGVVYMLVNAGANALQCYLPTSGTIGGGANVPYALAAGASAEIISQNGQDFTAPLPASGGALPQALSPTDSPTFAGVTVTGALTSGGAAVCTSSKGAVSQTNSQTDPVTYNGSSVNLSTVSLSLGPGGITSFTFNNTSITTNSVVLVGVTGINGPNPAAVAVCAWTINGSCGIVIYNAHATMTLSGVVRLGILVC